MRLRLRRLACRGDHGHLRMLERGGHRFMPPGTGGIGTAHAEVTAIVGGAIRMCLADPAGGAVTSHGTRIPR